MAYPERYLITSALPYANGPLHIGHIAGAYLPADIYVRYLRLRGARVAFICGSDEHGAAITIQAKKEGVSPREIIDKYHALNKQSFQDIGISFDIYHRTSSDLHHQTASQFFLTLYKKGIFEERETEQYYDQEYQQFLADRYITGTCPKCGYEKAYGDQCEKCGSSLNPTDLINPVSTLSGKPPVLKKTRHWYLPLNRYEKWLREWIIEGKGRREEWKRNVLGQCKSWLDEGLQPRAITRDLDWGVKVPLDGAEGKVLYVWLDAPIGYISATIQWAADHGIDWHPWWQDENTKLVHFIGKDNIVFHCIIFPVILKAHGDYILPANVPANEFMNLEGNKISTSRNWAIWIHEYVREFTGKEDVLRYVLCANMPETRDSEFTWSDFQQRNNNELVGILGNLVNRTVVLIHKYFGGKVPPNNSREEEAEKSLHASIVESVDRLGEALENYRFRDALNEMMNIARAGNKYLTETEPWKQVKTNPDKTAAILYHSAQTIARLTIAMQPFMPFSSEKLRNQLRLPEDIYKWENLQKRELLPPGHEIDKPALLFTKIEDKIIRQQVDKLKKRDRLPETGESKETKEVDFDVFAQLQIKTGVIQSAEKIAGTDKLLKLTVDLGNEIRTIVSGIAGHYSPEQVTGQQVCVVANLKPRKIRGVESKGMILTAETPDGRLVFITPAEDIPPGSLVR